MTGATDRPLSVVVWGNSCAVLSFGAQDRAAGPAYPALLRDRLAEAGVPAVLTVRARWFDFATRAVRRYEAEVRSAAPDVLILQFGLNEAQPWLVPVWLLRHLLARDRATTRLGRLYRRRVGARMWHLVRAYRRGISPRLGMTTWQTTPRRFESAMTRAISMPRGEFHPLILVLDLAPPGPPLSTGLAHMPQRHLEVNAVLARCVAAFGDPEVRLIHATDVADEIGARQALPDGMHFSPAAHRRMAEILADQILPWLAQRQADAPRTAL